MRDSIYKFTLDVHNISSQVQVVAKKNDSARKMVITLMEYGKPYAIEEGSKAVLMMKKPDENILFNDCYMVSGSIVYDFTNQTTNVEGLCECELRLYAADKTIITSPRFTILVSETVYEDGQVESSNEFSALTETMVRIADFESQIQTAVDAANDAQTYRDQTEVIKDDAVAETTAIKNTAENFMTEAQTYASNAQTSARNAEASKQYIIDHRDELKGEAGVIYKDTEPTDPAERVGIWINPNAPFVPIPTGGGADIDDNVVATDKTWSSAKIDSYKSEFVTPTQLEEAIGGALNGTY